jgi:prepilin signal peptidase PulO-like enzyme (type II secretory pathway)
MTEASPTIAPELVAESPTVTPDEPVAPSEPRAPLRELMPQGLMSAVVVLASVALVVACFADFGFSGRALLGAVFCPLLLLLAVIDARHKLLPNELVLGGTLVVALIVAATSPGDFLGHLAIGAAVGGFLFLFAAIFPAGLGMGDAKLAFLLGLALGSRTASAMTVALLGLFLAALWILATQGSSARKQAIPFGPFLALGGVLAFFFG